MKKFFLLLLIILPRCIFSSDTTCEVIFSHQAKLSDRLIELIDQEKQSIFLTSYSLHHTPIAKALIRAQKRGVKTEVLIDPFSIKKRSSIHRLLEANIPLYVWDKQLKMLPKKGKAKMHDNFCIFGNDTVWTGSFSPTLAASKHNQENAVVLKNPEIAKGFKETFFHLKLYESRPYQEYNTLYGKKGGDKKSEVEYASSLPSKGTK